MEAWQQLVATLVVAVVGTGGTVGILTLRQQRAKLGAEADRGMASAAETLTGAALQMVQSAEARALAAARAADRAESDAQEAQRIANLAQLRLARLIAWIRTQGLDPPDWVEQ